MNPDMGNAYCTYDNAISWNTIKEWDENGESRNPVWIDFSRQDPDFGLAIDDAGRLMKTTDRRRSWKYMKWETKGLNSCITVDPNDDNIWYVGAGQFWRVKVIHRSLANLHGTKHPDAEYGHIYKSIDKGKTWTKITDNFDPGLDVARIIVDPQNSQIVYAATNFGFYKSTNAGINWNLSGNGLPYNQPRDIQSYSDHDSGEFILFLLEQTHFEPDGNGSITSTGGVFKSNDRGENWEDITGNLAYDFSSIHHDLSIEKYYRAIAYWFDIAVSSAKNIYPVLPESIYTVFNRIIVNPKNKDEIYISNNVKHDYSFTPGEIWKTEDGGKTWFITARYGTYWGNQTDKFYWETRNNLLGQNMKFAHMERDLNKEDILGGCRFMHANADGDILISMEQQVLRSSNGGQSWEQVDDFETYPGSGHWVGRGGSNLPGHHLLVETGMKNTYLFCSGEHGLWRNTQDGELVYPDAVAVEQMTGQSRKANDALSICAVAVHPRDTNTWYILMFRQYERGKFRVTTDAGKTWTNPSYPVQWDGNLSGDHIFQYTLRIDPEQPDNIYFCVPTKKRSDPNGPEGFNDYGVYRSRDGGYTWDRANNGFPANASVYRLELDRNNPQILYAALNENINGDPGGLYKTTNRGDNWTQVNIPAGIISVNDVHLNPNSGYLYISCGRFNGTIEEGGVWISRDNGLHWEKIFYFPRVFQASTSLNNPEIITVATAPSRAIGKINPGAYLSRDGGKSWMKINYGLGQPGQIQEIRPDPYDKNVYWCALTGSGWYRGLVKPGIIARAFSATVFEGDLVTLDGTTSVGNNLSYKWNVPEGIYLSTDNEPVVYFTAPKVDEQTIFDVTLTIDNGSKSDKTGIKILVRPLNATNSREIITAVLKVFPNPIRQTFRIEGITEPVLLTLYNLEGRMVLNHHVKLDEQIDISFLIPGLYIGSVESKGTKIVFKLVVE